MGAVTSGGDERDRRLVEAGLLLAEEPTLWRLVERVKGLAEATGELSREALAGAAPEAVLRVAVRRARELLGADLAIALLLDGEGWSRVAAADGDPGGTARPPAVAFAPLAGRSGPLGGLLVATTAPPRRFDGELLDRLAEHTSAVLEHARSRQRLARLLPLDDLEHLTTDIHDAVVQALYAVGLGLEGTMAAADDPWLTERVEGALTDIDAVIRDVRTRIVGLHPALTGDDAL